MSISLTANNLFSSCDKVKDSIKNFYGNPKVQKIAKEIFKAISCIVFGAAMGALLFSPLGMTFAGFGIGVGIGALAYFAVAIVYHTIQTYGFPSHRYRTTSCITTDQWLTEEAKKKFNQAFDDLKPLNCFQQWAKNPSNTKEKMWSEFHKGLCQGEAQGLIMLLKNYSSLRGEEFLGRLKPKTVFYRQMLEIIRANLPETPGADIPDANQIDLITFTHTELANNPKFLFDKLSSLQSGDKAVAMTIRLQNSKGAHTIFAEISPNLRFYDPINYIFTGLHENFPSKEKFLKSLQAHIEGYQSITRPLGFKYDEVIIRIYEIDPEITQTTAIAGSNQLN